MCNSSDPIFLFLCHVIRIKRYSLFSVIFIRSHFVCKNGKDGNSLTIENLYMNGIPFNLHKATHTQKEN